MAEAGPAGDDHRSAIAMVQRDEHHGHEYPGISCWCDMKRMMRKSASRRRYRGQMCFRAGARISSFLESTSGSTVL
jgi:hypothetical protein